MEIERTFIIETNAEADRAAAIEAYASGLLDRVHCITPAGKRTARSVHTSNGRRQIRLYLSGRIYKRGATIHEARDWVA